MDEIEFDDEDFLEFLTDLSTWDRNLAPATERGEIIDASAISQSISRSQSAINLMVSRIIILCQI